MQFRIFTVAFFINVSLTESEFMISKGNGKIMISKSSFSVASQKTDSIVFRND